MKEAIAIINVPDDENIDELCITFDLERMINEDGDVETIWGGISEPLRPLPKKAEMTDDWRVAGLIETESGRMVRCYFKGYNTCLSEITGETE